MNEIEKIISDLQIAKFILCHPQMLTPEMYLRIGQAITSAVALLKEQETVCVDINKNMVMSCLEGLAQDDWRMWHSDSEVHETAKAALKMMLEEKQ